MKLRVLPNSLWLVYNALNVPAIEKLLPPDLKLANVRVFDTDVPRPKLMFNSYDVESKWMNGHRLEIVTIARSKLTRTLHFVVLDCVSNALMWDPIDGIRLPNGKCNLNVEGNDQFKLAIDKRFLWEDKSGMFRVEGGKQTKPTAVSKQFSIYPNYLCYFKHFDKPFPMRFDESIVAQRVRKLSITSLENDLWEDFRESIPTHSFVYDSCMDFYVDEVSFSSSSRENNSKSEN